MRLGVLIPDRGDRPELLQNCLRMVCAQTRRPDVVELVNDAPISEKCDITWRYRLGFERLQGKVEIIALMENDDWYSVDYLETMLKEWESHGKPDIFGTNYTIYYNIRLKKWFTMEHYHRASAMNTLVRPDINFQWPLDHEPYTDLHLWKQMNGVTFRPKRHISLGIKHGIGLCGGHNHTDKLHKYINEDYNMEFIRGIMDRISFEFYSKLFR